MENFVAYSHTHARAHARTHTLDNRRQRLEERKKFVHHEYQKNHRYDICDSKFTTVLTNDRTDYNRKFSMFVCCCSQTGINQPERCVFSQLLNAGALYGNNYNEAILFSLLYS